MAGRCPPHEWGKWFRKEDEKGNLFIRQCFHCGKKQWRRKATVKAVFDVLVRETGIIAK